MDWEKLVRITGVYESSTAYSYVVETIAEIPAAYWHKVKKLNHLGMLYGVDISNYLHRLTNGQTTVFSQPVVSDRANAKKGIKTIRLSYYFNSKSDFELLQFFLRISKKQSEFKGLKLVVSNGKQVA